MDAPPSQVRAEVETWKRQTDSKPSAVLLCVRCDVRYTAEEYEIYREFLKLWGDDSIKKRLVVVFTFGDRQDRDIRQELKTVCRELQRVLGDASWRYVVFNDKASALDKDMAVYELLKTVQMIREPTEKIPLPIKVIGIVMIIIVSWLALPAVYGYVEHDKTFFWISIVIVVAIVVVLTVRKYHSGQSRQLLKE